MTLAEMIKASVEDAIIKVPRFSDETICKVFVNRTKPDIIQIVVRTYDGGCAFRQFSNGDLVPETRSEIKW